MQENFYPEEIRDILNNHKMTEENTGKLRNYFMNPSVFDMQKKTIIFSTPSRTGTSFFRLELPMYAIATNFPGEFNIIYADNNLNPKHLQIANLIVGHRAGHLHEWMHSVAKVWPQTSKKFVMLHDVDDNEFNLPDSHPMKQMWLAANKDKMSIRSLKESDYITTTGWQLKKTFRNFNPNVSVFRNQFDWEQPQWKVERTFPAKKDKLVIGWVGLTSHFEDIKKMQPIMKYIHDKYPNTEFIIAGMAIKDTFVHINVNKDGGTEFKEEEITDEKQTYRFRVKELFKDFAPDRIQFFDALPLEVYGKFYAMLDISFCFIEKNTFNACKSEIKTVESMYYKNITLSTKYGGYKDMYELMPKDIVHKYNFIDSEFTKPWSEALEYCVMHYDEMFKYAEMQSAWVKNFYNINLHISDRVEFYNHIIEQQQETEVNRISKLL